MKSLEIKKECTFAKNNYSSAKKKNDFFCSTLVSVGFNKLTFGDILDAFRSHFRSFGMQTHGPGTHTSCDVPQAYAGKWGWLSDPDKSVSVGKVAAKIAQT